MRHTEEQLVGVQIPDHECRPAPIHPLGCDALCEKVFAKRLDLIVVETDKDSSLAGPSAVPTIRLVENQFETEETDLTHPRPSLFLIVPVHREAQLLFIEMQRALRIGDEKDASGIETIHGWAPAPVDQVSRPRRRSHRRPLIPRSRSPARCRSAGAQAHDRWSDRSPSPGRRW